MEIDEDLCEEIWRLVPSLNNKYEVSNLGRFRNATTKKILKQFENIHGYMVLQARPEMYKVVNVRIHRVVAEVFLGPCPDGYVVNHKDGNKKNNHVDNLEYVTPSENNQHALDTGLRNPWNGKNARKGTDNHFATISEDVVYEILRIRDQTGYGCRRIGKMLNLSRSVVNHILSGHSWKETVEKYYKEKGENQNA